MTADEVLKKLVDGCLSRDEVEGACVLGEYCESLIEAMEYLNHGKKYMFDLKGLKEVI